MPSTRFRYGPPLRPVSSQGVHCGACWATVLTMGVRQIRFEPFEFDCGSLTLRRDGAVVPLGTRGAALLHALLEAEGAVVPKDALISRAWPGMTVEESNLAVQIGALRKVLGRRDDGSAWIATAA